MAYLLIFLHADVIVAMIGFFKLEWLLLRRLRQHHFCSFVWSVCTVCALCVVHACRFVYIAVYNDMCMIVVVSVLFDAKCSIVIAIGLLAIVRAT